MRKLLAAIGLLGGLWFSNVFAAIVTYDITVTSNSWSNTGVLPYGVVAQPTFTGALAVDNTLTGSAALVDFNLVKSRCCCRFGRGMRVLRGMRLRRRRCCAARGVAIRVVSSRNR